MEASSVTGHPLRHAFFRDWAWWRLPPLVRCYVGAVPLAAFAAIAFAASRTIWTAADLWKYLLLLACAVASVAATTKVAYLKPGMTRDFLTAWVLPVAILLPPIYAMVTPIPLQVLTHRRVQGVVHRRVFTVGAISLAYGAASLVFRQFPASFAGGTVGVGTHALTWTLAVIACEMVGGRGHQLLILAAIKLSNSSVRLSDVMLNREALQADFAEFDLGVLITVVIGVNPVLAIIAVPTVLLARRFIMHAQLLAQSRIDSKTGLLNASTWEAEATIELARAVRTDTPLSIALVDIDHFKMVNDTHGHLVGDKVLRAVTDALRSQLRSYDLAGRFGGEEFALLLPHAREPDAISIAERLRTHVAGMAIPVDDLDESAGFVRLTISVGVSSLDGVSRELTDMMAAADTALYHAKETGRNKTHAITATA
jgi:diguanylate cyclase (GGDEF)-like protein